MSHLADTCRRNLLGKPQLTCASLVFDPNMRHLGSYAFAILLTVPSLVAAPLIQPPTALKPNPSTAVAGQDIVETAKAAGFQTLVAALEAAEMVDVLKGAGPLTVFAPSDEAFAALPVGTLQSLLLPENKQKLRDILALHVVQGQLVSFEVGNIDVPQMARMASGERLSVSADGKGFRIGEAQVVRADVRCSNGWIQVIDRVLLPAELNTEERMKMAIKEAAPTSLLEALRAVPDGRYSTFLAAVAASGADQDWAQPEPMGNWTLFVPTNEAFARIDEAELAALLAPANRDALRALLDWHALPEVKPFGFEFDDRQRGPVMISRNKDRFVLDVLGNGMVFVYTLRTSRDRDLEEPFKARIVAGDIPVGGTLVHVVDRVILPPLLENNLIKSQAYKEKDVEELAAGGEAQFHATYYLPGWLDEARNLDERGAVAMYTFGLRMLEDVLPVSRRGMMLTGGDQNDPAQLRARLQARIADLDRVWYAMFLKNSPSTRTLAGPLPGVVEKTRSSGALVPKVLVAPAQVVTVPVKTDAQADRVADLSWCEVLEQTVDAQIVVDPALRAAITATGLPWRVKDKASGIEMLLVPPGSFSMGKSQGDVDAMANEAPAHQVTLTRPYYLGRYEVTRAQWSKVMAGAPTREPESRGGASIGGGLVVEGGVELRDQQGNVVQSRVTTTSGDDGTITVTTTAVDPNEERSAAAAGSDTPIGASGKQIAEFARRTGLRLPTEAEWERACRAGVDQPRYGKLDDIAWHRGNSPVRMNPVGLKAPNGLGFHDMLGNAWELVSDWYADYTRQPQVDPVGPATGTERIVRGSYFDEFDASFCRASRRYTIQTPMNQGFRVARTP